MSIKTSSTSAEGSPLGRSSAYVEQYAPELLYPIARSGNRGRLGIAGDLPFHGVDSWTAYELSWLSPTGLPQVALARFEVPADSPNIVESKSFKLYLNSFNQTVVDDRAALVAMLSRDLSAAAGAAVWVELLDPTAADVMTLAEPSGTLIDSLPVAIDCYGPPAPELLRTLDGQADEALVSQLLKSNCPVTGQPDWASLRIAYRGPRIDPASLLRYIVSYRQHSDFHEHCVERIFCDIQQRCAPERLSVEARYTRRGGLDINPFRSSDPGDRPEGRRGVRQ